MTTAHDRQPAEPVDPFFEVLALRERYRDDYLRQRDPIAEDRTLWRAQTFRHLVHLLPGQSVLELGCGQGWFTRKLVRVTRGENPITAVTFTSGAERPSDLPSAVEFLEMPSLPGELQDKRFNFIVAIDLLDRHNSSRLLQGVYELLEPGGQVILYQSNPWNLVLKLHRLLWSYLGRRDPRSLLSRPQLYELLSEVGFIRVFSVYNDFVYAPLTQDLVWHLRNLSILLENAHGEAS